MAQLGVLAAGVGVPTTITQSFVPGVVLLPDSITPPNIQSLTTAIDGDTLLNLQGVDIIQAYAEYMKKSNLTVPTKSNGLVIASGFIPKQTLQLNLVNNAAGAVNVFGYSYKKDGVPVVGGMVVAQANSYVEIDNFTALFFLPANFARAQVYFSDGHNEQMVDAELRSLFSLSNDNTDGGLDFGSVTVIDNQYGNISRVTLYANGVGNLTIAKVIIP